MGASNTQPTIPPILKFVVENAPHAIAIMDTQMQYVYANAVWQADFGLQHTAFIGRSHYHLFPELPQFWREIHARALSGETVSGSGDTFQHEDGRTDFVSWKVTPWHTDDGAIAGVVMYSYTITEAEQWRLRVDAARASDAAREDLLQNVLDHAPIIVSIFDRNGRIIVTEGQAVQQLRLNPEELIGQSVFELLRDDHEVLQRIRQGLSGQTVSAQLSIGPRVYETRYTPLFDAEGEVERLLSVSYDITERVETERELEATSAGAQALYDTARAVANAPDLDAVLDVVVRSAKRRGATSAGIFGIDNGLADEPTAVEVIAAWDSAGTPRIPVGTRYELAQFPMSKLWLSSPDEPLLVSNVAADDRIDDQTRTVMEAIQIAAFVFIPLRRGDNWIGVLAINWSEPRDFTELENLIYRSVISIASPAVETLRNIVRLRTTAEDRRRLIRELEESLLFKDQFLSTMSHELRTPLNAILGYAGIVLDEENLDDDISYMVSRIEGNSRRLLTLINDVLDISRINADRVRLIEKPMPLQAAMENLRNDFWQQAQDKQLTLRLVHDATLPTYIIADEERLAQIIGNLVQNAIKFTPSGEISIETTRLNTTEWQIHVHDTGVGIPETWQHLVFDEFRQVDATSRRKYGGAGLGLSIVKKLCVLMGGSVVLQSELNKGSTFTVTLPLRAAEDIPLDAATSTDTSALT